MTDQAFLYDEDRLARCAKWTRSVLIVCDGDTNSKSTNNSTVVRDDEATTIAQRLAVGGNGTTLNTDCWTLFDDYSTHFQRPQRQHDMPNNHPLVLDSSTTTTTTLGQSIMTSRWVRFLESVLFVDSHNNNHNNNDGPRHKVTLNRFSDGVDIRSWSTILLQPDHLYHPKTMTAMDHRPETRNTSRKLGWRLEEEEEDTTGDSRMKLPKLALGHGSFNKLSPKPTKRRKNGLPSRTVRIPATDAEPFRAAPNVGRELDGFIVTLKKNKEAQIAPSSFSVWDDDDDVISSSSIDAVPQVLGNYNRFLNWATEENPDGVPIVHDAMDQGACGSCWALAATGSLEASAARRSAYAAYKSYLTQHHPSFLKVKHRGGKESVRDKAIAIAQKVEQSAIRALNLSIQELIDCDTTVDQGCTGGNPLLAFHFVHRYGLVDWADYPYTGREDACQPTYSRRPLATVKAWGLIQSNHERHMELALRYLGPIAVGLNGASPSFLSYKDGVYDEPNCKEGANHALLIVGYGEERDAKGRKIRYWIARNSWGKGWGENGFVRIKRGSGAKGEVGVCGLSNNPSVAIGGMLLGEEQQLLQQEGLQTDFEDPVYLYCSRMGWSERSACLRLGGWLYEHKALMLGVVGLTCLLGTLYTLTIDCRRRRKRQRERKERRRHDQHQSNVVVAAAQQLPPPTEASPLLGDSGQP
mmetsp:Transcript_10229/g.28179  ORF Transcript_10229/g.28179 Transcript_10229/m.28179 type:complete len:695 (+) Transcript_10229:109-2193(+)|eukprot:CAMPEP_0168745242 /NCGR_PEP_ID=MMETSP0724-20121128/14511_1 /TAXON_ID=265536 /ORGANISM="Amphiprora sp., Strain CCMP467" /LENGTH=694 /DNA_ID=CAMNT_0008792937 /DNA_START=38 /DNA_END=2122 /DNA_ORIENTATION=+